MTDKQKKKIRELRIKGLSYQEIADIVDASKDAVRAYCRTNDIKPSISRAERKNLNICLACGSPIEQTPGKRRRKFCNPSCRTRYWNRNNDATEVFTCHHCGKEFHGFKSKNPKFCSHECYILSRFGKEPK